MNKKHRIVLVVIVITIAIIAWYGYKKMGWFGGTSSSAEKSSIKNRFNRPVDYTPNPSLISLCFSHNYLGDSINNTVYKLKIYTITSECKSLKADGILSGMKELVSNKPPLNADAYINKLTSDFEVSSNNTAYATITKVVI